MKHNPRNWFYKKITILLTCMLCIFQVIPVYATELNALDDDVYFIINGTEVVTEDENYENAETGEYFRWTEQPSSRASSDVVKNFEFKIRFSVQSSYFDVNGTKVKVTSSAHVEDKYGQTTDYSNGTKYIVAVHGIYSRKLNFSVGGTESGTISGLQNGGSYCVIISTGEAIGAYDYLVGNGTIKLA